MDKENNTLDYYWVTKKEKKILPFVMWMDLEGTMLTEIGQRKRDKYCVISLMGGILKLPTT